MSKAEDRALEKYPLMSNDDKEGLEALKYIGMECECAYMFNEVQEAKQACFIEGYHQAEKDLELTWNDVALILNTAEEFNRKNTVLISDEEYFKEILKRFKDYKK